MREKHQGFDRILVCLVLYVFTKKRQSLDLSCCSKSNPRGLNRLPNLPIVLFFVLCEETGGLGICGRIGIRIVEKGLNRRENSGNIIRR